METPTAVMEDLQTSFAAMNALEFAKHLHTLSIPDAVKSEWLRAKVMATPTENEDAMESAIARVMERFWNRLSEPK